MPTEVQAPRLRELSPEQAARAAELLDEGLDLPPAERDRWLAALAQRDAELAPVVAALLRTAADAEPAETAQLVARSVARRAAEAEARTRTGTPGSLRTRLTRRNRVPIRARSTAPATLPASAASYRTGADIR